MESRFFTDFDLRDVLDGQHFDLISALIFFSKERDGFIVMPKGSRTDLASVPQIVQSVVPKTGKWNRAAGLHDLGYRYNGAIPVFNIGQPLRNAGLIERLDVDNLLLEAMIADGVDPVHCKIIYEGVRMGGWDSWKDHAHESGTYNLDQAILDFQNANIPALL